MIVWPWIFGPIQKSTTQQRLRKPADFWTYPKIRCADRWSCGRGFLDQSKNPRHNNDYESQRIFGLIQKSVVRIGDRVAVNFWTTPKIHDTQRLWKPADVWTYPKIRCAVMWSCGRGFLDQSKNPRHTTITKASGFFGLIQKSVVLIGDRVTVDFWINPKIHDTHNDYESQRIFGHVQKSAVLISCSCDRGFWTNPKIHNTNSDYESHRIFGLSKNPLCG